MDDLGSGLRSQDSLGITRARLAKQRLNESTALLDDIKNMEVMLCQGLQLGSATGVSVTRCGWERACGCI